MLGINAKRGIATTLERVFKSTGNKFNNLEILWTGKTAGILFSRSPDGTLDAKLIFPAIDETVEIPVSRFNNLIGYALHELGHAWFTDNKPWDRAREKGGQFLGSLINGLEDPRIERKVIESGYAPNSRALFGELINSVLKKDGYVDPTEKCQIPFILAVEGRRLNGYDISVPNIIDESPYAEHLHWALKKAHTAKETGTIVRIAVELFERLKEQDKQSEGQDEGDGQEGQEKGKGGFPNKDGGDEPSDQPEQDGDGDGDGQDGDGQDGDGGDQGGEGQDGDGQDGQPSDKPSDKPSNKGKGKGSYDDKGRDVEPTSFIEDELKNESSTVDNGTPRPVVLKPVIQTFEWR
jgi:hypothetical protein